MRTDVSRANPCAQSFRRRIGDPGARARLGAIGSQTDRGGSPGPSPMKAVSDPSRLDTPATSQSGARRARINPMNRQNIRSNNFALARDLHTRLVDIESWKPLGAEARKMQRFKSAGSAQRCCGQGCASSRRTTVHPHAGPLRSRSSKVERPFQPLTDAVTKIILSTSSTD